MAKKMEFDLVDIAHLGGQISGATKVISQMTDAQFSLGVVGDEVLTTAARKFSKSWDFRRKYFVKNLKKLGKAADSFVRDVVRSDKAAAAFMDELRQKAVDGMGTKR